MHAQYLVKLNRRRFPVHFISCASFQHNDNNNNNNNNDNLYLHLIFFYTFPAGLNLKG